jgi:MerR family transcriptional regulator, thiopeptide resistance regulator
MNENIYDLELPKFSEVYTVGELAKMSGITVRTLQYYDRCGLLTCAHSEGGRRLYGRHDLILLQQILFFKSFGFSLAQIRDRLIEVNSGAELAKLLTTQRDVIKSEIKSLNKMTENLESIICDVQDCDEIGADKFVAIVETVKLTDPNAFMLRYFNENQLVEITDRMGNSSEMKDQQKRSQHLFGELLRLYQSGTDPKGEEGQQLADSFWQMVMDFSGGNPEMIKSFISMGIDSKNWPEDAKELGGAVSEFMSIAMYTYFKNKGIPLDTFAALIKL